MIPADVVKTMNPNCQQFNVICYKSFFYYITNWPKNVKINSWTTYIQVKSWNPKTRVWAWGNLILYHLTAMAKIQTNLEHNEVIKKYTCLEGSNLAVQPSISLTPTSKRGLMTPHLLSLPFSSTTIFPDLWSSTNSNSPMYPKTMKFSTQSKSNKFKVQRMGSTWISQQCIYRASA